MKDTITKRQNKQDLTNLFQLFVNAFKHLQFWQKPLGFCPDMLKQKKVFLKRKPIRYSNQEKPLILLL